MFLAMVAILFIASIVWMLATRSIIEKRFEARGLPNHIAQSFAKQQVANVIISTAESRNLAVLFFGLLELGGLPALAVLGIAFFFGLTAASLSIFFWDAKYNNDEVV